MLRKLPKVRPPQRSSRIFKQLTRDTLSRTLRDPFSAAGLLVDLLPIYAVLFLGWGAAPLVLLYWFENVLIGIATVPRILLSGFFGEQPQPFSSIFLAAFFSFHYGMFTFVHGVFVLAMVAGAFGGPISSDVSTDMSFTFVMHLIEQVWGFALIYIVWHIVALIYQDILGKSYEHYTSNEAMGAPYGRIVVLHIGILGGAFLALALGDPLLGALGLIILKTAWTLFMNVIRKSKETIV